MLISFPNSKFKAVFYKTFILKYKSNKKSFVQEKSNKILSESDGTVKHMLSK